MVDPFHGTIALGFIQPLGSSFIPDLIVGFQKETPEIRFQLIQDTTKVILSQIESAEKKHLTFNRISMISLSIETIQW